MERALNCADAAVLRKNNGAVGGAGVLRPEQRAVAANVDQRAARQLRGVLCRRQPHVLHARVGFWSKQLKLRGPDAVAAGVTIGAVRHRAVLERVELKPEDLRVRVPVGAAHRREEARRGRPLPGVIRVRQPELPLRDVWHGSGFS